MKSESHDAPLTHPRPGHTREIVKHSIQRFRRWAAIPVATVLATGAILLFKSARSPQFTQVTANPEIRVGIKDMQPGEVRFFVYEDRVGQRIRFLLARDSTGQIKAAFDACERCYLYHKGYISSGGDLICKYCGNHYKLETMQSGLASCIPVKLPIQTVGQTATIKSAELERQRGLF